jgi:hypothetical protein
MTEWTTVGGVFGEIILEVFWLNGRLIDAGDSMAAPVGQTSARWQVLGVVAGGPVSVAQVARTMRLTRQSVQRTVDLLAADGLVRYADNPHHRRAKLMTMTTRRSTSSRLHTATAGSVGQPDRRTTRPGAAANDRHGTAPAKREPRTGRAKKGLVGGF